MIEPISLSSTPKKNRPSRKAPEIPVKEPKRYVNPISITFYVSDTTYLLFPLKRVLYFFTLLKFFDDFSLWRKWRPNRIPDSAVYTHDIFFLKNGRIIAVPRWTERRGRFHLPLSRDHKP
jgi:hypothetical protein